MKMKKRILSCLLAFACTAGLWGCGESSGENTEVSSTEIIETQPATTAAVSMNVPEITQIRSICELATLECYYHNVAKAVKEKGDGLVHWGEKDRTFWIEYKGTVKIGIDMSGVMMTVENGVYVITIPKAEILSINIDPESLNEDSYIFSQDSWNPNYITADDQTKAIEAAQNNMKESVLNNSALLINAQDRAKKLIENYINQLEAASGTNFTIKWNYENNTPAAQSATESK